MNSFKSRVDIEINRKLSKRSYFAAPLYAVLFLIVVNVTTILQDFRWQTQLFAALLIVTGAGRWALADIYLRKPEQTFSHWRYWFSMTTLAAGCTWGLFCFFVIAHYGMTPNTFVVLFPTAGILGATVVSLALFPLLSRAHILSMTAPIILASILRWNDGGKAYAILATVYLLYLQLQAKLVSKTALVEIENALTIADQKAELEHAWNKALDADRVKARFLALMSHEMRTPLNGIFGLSDLLLDQPLSPQGVEYTQTIRECSNQLLTLVDDVLEFSQIEAGTMIMESHVFDLVSCVTSSLQLFEVSASAKGLKLNLLIDPDVPKNVKGDSKRLRQILNNLLSNAVKFTSAGHVALKVTTRVIDKQIHRLSISVEDTGTGLSAEALSMLFQPFTPSDASAARATDGKGLGLALCQKFSVIMGGGVQVESVLGQGSIFTLTIPIDVVEPTRTSLLSPASLPAGSVPVFRDHYVLVVEDNRTNQKIIVAMLKKAGLECDVVFNGVECMKALSDKSYSLILMDCRMPLMDGYETTRRIRARADLQDLPIIALTANALEGDREKCLEAGMTDYLSKPIKFPMLFDAISTALAGRPGL